MPPKRPAKSATAAAGGNGEKATKRRKKAPAKKAAAASSDSEFDSDIDNGNGHAPVIDEVGDTAVDEVVDESLYPKESTTVGRLLISGGTNWDLTGRKELPKSVKNAPNACTGRNLWGPADSGIRVRFVCSGPTACHSLIITEDGKIMTFGRNDNGQLGLGDTIRRDEPTEVTALKDHKIVGGAVGRGHTLFLTSKGLVFACGDNKMGQLGIGSQSQSALTPTRVAHRGKPIVKVACGAEFSMIVDCVGNLYSFGYPQYGQLGHNTEGKYFASGNKLAYRCELSPRRVMYFIEKSRDNHVIPVENVKIVDVACGVNHTVALDQKMRVFSFGWGGYGRLGHTEAKDEFIPRLIKTFDQANRGVKQIWCGSTFSLALDQNNLLYFWGQAKTSGEATMYPKNVQDLNGWNVRSVGCANKSIVVAADESVISWGPSPTYGELAYGDNKAKSSTVPQEVKPLEGIYVHSVSCGYGHSLFIARDESEEEKKLINDFPSWP